MTTKRQKPCGTLRINPNMLAARIGLGNIHYERAKKMPSRDAPGIRRPGAGNRPIPAGDLTRARFSCSFVEVRSHLASRRCHSASEAKFSSCAVTWTWS